VFEIDTRKGYLTVDTDRRIPSPSSSIDSQLHITSLMYFDMLIAAAKRFCENVIEIREI
jgi:hypothetical protein